MLKRFFAAALAALTSLAALTPGSFALPRLRGDANGDGKLNVRDAVGIMKLIANGDENAPELADYDGDGALNAKDVTDLMKYLVGYHTENDELLELKYGVSAPDFEVPDVVTERTVSASDFGFSESAGDNSDAFAAAAAYLAANPGTTLKFEKGTYRMGKSRVDLAGLRNCVIDGSGSTLLYNERNYFTVAGCDGLKIENLTIDWDPQSYHIASVARVKSVSGGVVEFEFPREKDASYALTNDWGVMFNLDPVDLAPGVPGKGDWVGNEPYVKNRTLTAPNVITAYAPDLPLNEGEVYLIRHYQYGAQAFMVEGGSANIVFEDLTIHTGPSTGFILQDKVHHVRFTRLTIEPKSEDFERCPISTTADAINIRDTLGYIIMEGCSIGYCYDDYLNVNDNVGVATGAEGSVLGLRAFNWTAFRPGDSVSFRSKSDFSKLGVSARIVALSAQGNDWTLTLDRDVSGSVDEGTIVHNDSTDSTHVIVRDCYFHQGRSRVLLGAGDSIIENCRFYKSQLTPLRFSIEMFAENGAWAGGEGVNNVIIRNNVFDSGNVKNQRSGSVIDFEAQNDSDRSGRLAGECFTNVMIAHNRFIDPAGAMIYATGVKNLTVFGNICECTREPWANVSASAVGKIYVRGKYFDGTSIVANCWLASEYFPARVNDVSMPSGSGSFVTEDNRIS